MDTEFFMECEEEELEPWQQVDRDVEGDDNNNDHSERWEVAHSSETHASMEPVNELVKKTMPSLSSHKMGALLARLEALGVTSVDDLINVNASDLENTLTIIQCRRLIKAFEDGSQAATPSTSPGPTPAPLPQRDLPVLPPTPPETTPPAYLLERPVCNGRRKSCRGAEGMLRHCHSSDYWPNTARLFRDFRLHCQSKCRWERGRRASDWPTEHPLPFASKESRESLPPCCLHSRYRRPRAGRGLYRSMPEITPPKTAGPTIGQTTYSVPWHKMPSAIMDSFTAKKWIPASKRAGMIRMVVEDHISKHRGQRPTRAQLREVAQKIVDQYPLSFQETEPFGNKPFASNGCSVLLQQLENRVENLKRDSKGVCPRRKRSRYSDRYGCVAWQPAVEGPECRAALQSKQEELKCAFKTHDHHHQESSVRQMMIETYPIQREAINDGTSVKVMKEEWPFLFEAAHLFDHTSRLLGFLVLNKLAEELSSKESGINNFLDSIGMKLGNGPVPLISGIARYLKENPDRLFYQNEDSMDVDLGNLPCTPCILLRGDQQFKIAVDQVIVNDHFTSPTAALAYAFALFYVCNIEYPKEMALTLEFMQRVFFGINPDRGSKVEQQGQKQHHIPAKLAKFVSQLKDFQSGVDTKVPRKVNCQDLPVVLPTPPETTPPETAPPETAPPETTPPETAPPETAPLETTPLETTPPETTPPETTFYLYMDMPETTPSETTPPETTFYLYLDMPETAPPETTPPETAPPETAPPETAPPETAPPETAPPETAPPETAPPKTAPPKTAPPKTAPPETTGSPSCLTYSVPWHKMPSEIMDSFTAKKWIPANKRGDMIRMVVDDHTSKHHGQRPSRSQLREVAQKIIDRYPLSFQETEPFGNKPFASNGCSVLFQQLQSRVENQKRDNERKRPAEGDVSRRKRARYSDRYGCVAWQPAVEGPKCRAALESKQEELKSAFKTHDHHQESSVRKWMTETYPIQREAINDGTCVKHYVKVIKEEWPFLFEAVHLFDHASRLLGFLVLDKLAEELSSKESGINNFLDSKGMKLGDGPVQLINGIALHFKENPDRLFYQNKDSTDVDLGNLPCTPCILLRGDQQFKIAVDQVIVNDHITSPIAALAYAFALFYVCNMEYPKEMALTLEFMQRIFFGINPDRGSKAEQQGKKQHHIPARLAKFVSQLKDFESGVDTKVSEVHARRARDGGPKKKRSTYSDRYGCVEWRPAVKGTECRAALQSKQKELKSAFKTHDHHGRRASTGRVLLAQRSCIPAREVNCQDLPVLPPPPPETNFYLYMSMPETIPPETIPPETSPPETSPPETTAPETTGSPSCQTYSVPWHKMPSTIMDFFTAKKWIPAKKRGYMIRMVVDDHISKHHGQKPTRAQLRKVAQKIVDQYPLSFQETEPFGNKQVVSNGCSVLLQQLENRVENLRWDDKLMSQLKDFQSGLDTKVSEANVRRASTGHVLLALRPCSVRLTRTVNCQDLPVLPPTPPETTPPETTPPDTTPPETTPPETTPPETTPPETTPPETTGSPSCQTYSVPWHKMSSTIMDSFTAKKWIPANKRADMIRMVVDDLICKHHGQKPSRAQLREVAQKIVDQYPLSFQETEPFGNKPFVSNGCSVLFQQLESRIENMKRDGNFNKRPAEGDGPGRKKSRFSDRYGCVLWQPAVEGPECRAALESKREELKSAFKTHDHHQESSVRILMTETYPIQREAINDGTCVKVMKEEWPFLFEAVHLFDHASRLLGFLVLNKLAEELSSKESGINNFLDCKGRKLGDGPVQLISGIARYLKENPDRLFYQNEDSTDVDLGNLPCTPCILLGGDHHFKIAVDQVIVNDHITSPIAALAYAFALFYVCNIEYPKEMALTLEFMQRVFFGINPERGTKAEPQGKRQHRIGARMEKFVSQLKDFQSFI